MTFAVVVFPGSNSDYDAFYAASRVVGEHAELVWHKDTDLKGADAVILAVSHEQYQSGGWKLVSSLLKGGKGVVLDVKALLDREQKPAGVELWRL